MVNQKVWGLCFILGFGSFFLGAAWATNKPDIDVFILYSVVTMFFIGYISSKTVRKE